MCQIICLGCIPFDSDLHMFVTFVFKYVTFTMSKMTNRSISMVYIGIFFKLRGLLIYSFHNIIT